MHVATKKILYMVLIANLVVGAGYGLLFWQLGIQNQKSSKLLNTIEEQQQKQGQLSALRQIVEDTRDERESIQKAFIMPDNQVQFLEEVERLAASSGVTGRTTNVSTSGNPSYPVTDLVLSMETTGSYQNTMYFITRLENLPYVIRIENMSLTNMSESGGGGSWRNQITFRVTLSS